MSDFVTHTIESAPEGSRGALAEAQAKYGAVFNLFGALAESPVAVTAYKALGDLFEQSSFTPAERQLLLLAISAENGCEYCVAAHSAGAKMATLDDQAIEAVRGGTPIADARLATLRDFALAVVRQRGWVADDAVAGFLASGFTKAQVLEVIVAVAFKTISNYTNHIAQPPLDAPFEATRWARRAAA